MNLLPAQVWTRVMRFSGESGRRGTAFITSIENQEILVTAKHLCSDDRDETVTLQHPWTNRGQPTHHMLTRVGSLVAKGDVAAFRIEPETIIGVVGEVSLDATGISYSQEAFILGYPYDLSFDLGNGLQQLPLAKRGILSGSLRGPDDEQIHVIDAIANPGFSGGPMVFFPPGTTTPRFGGVVKGSIMAPSAERTLEEPNPPGMTAGLSYVTDTSSVKALLE